MSNPPSRLPPVGAACRSAMRRRRALPGRQSSDVPFTLRAMRSATDSLRGGRSPRTPPRSCRAPTWLPMTGPTTALQPQDALVQPRQHLLEAVGVLLAVGMGHHDAAAGTFFGHASLDTVLHQLFDALLARRAPRRTAQPAIGRDGEQGLHVQLRSRHRPPKPGMRPPRRSDSRSLHHELGVHEEPRLAGPFGQLARREPLVALLDGLVHQKPFGHRGLQGRPPVQLGLRERSARSRSRTRRSHVEAAPKARSWKLARYTAGTPLSMARPNASWNTGTATLGRRRRLFAVAHGLIEVVRRSGLVQVVQMLPVAHDVAGNPQKLHPRLVDHLERQVATGIRD